MGLGLFDDAVRRYLKPASQPTHLKELIHLLDVTPAREKSDMGAVLHDLAERFKKRGVVAVFSDFFDDPARILSGLKHFRHRRHEVIVFHILDPAEIEFPFRDTTLFKGMEGLPDVLDRAACSEARLPGRAERLSRRAEEGLPDGRHRLRSPAYRSKPGDPTFKLSGIAVGPHRLNCTGGRPGQTPHGISSRQCRCSGPSSSPTPACWPEWPPRRSRS